MRYQKFLIALILLCGLFTVNAYAFSIDSAREKNGSVEVVCKRDDKGAFNAVAYARQQDANDISTAIYFDLLQVDEGEDMSFSFKLPETTQKDKVYILTVSCDTGSDTKIIYFEGEGSVYLLGDINEDGLVDSKDASVLLQAIAKNDTASILERADVNKDKTADSKDASLILSYASGQTEGF